LPLVVLLSFGDEVTVLVEVVHVRTARGSRLFGSEGQLARNGLLVGVDVNM
jgi:hypothetical protein